MKILNTEFGRRPGAMRRCELARNDEYIVKVVDGQEASACRRAL
jgi:hypothetical protein